MNRKEIINKMAGAIRYVDLGGYECLNEYIEGSQKLAEAALDAFLEGVEEVNMESALAIITSQSELYQEILDLKKGADK